MQALNSSGSGDPSLVPASVCADPLMPGVNPLTFASNYANLATTVADDAGHLPACVGRAGAGVLCDGQLHLGAATFRLSRSYQL